MNAESTVFRASRPAVVVAPGGEGARAAAWLLAWPMRLAATPLGRRLLVAAVLAVVAVATVGYLYDSADQPRSAAAFRPTGGAPTPRRPRPSPGGRPASASRSARSSRCSSASSAAARSRSWWSRRPGRRCSAST